MYQDLKNSILHFQANVSISKERKVLLQPLIDYIQQKVNNKTVINLNFICTHNSRRSHLTQIWAQVAASYFDIRNVHCYSGGTEETAMFPMVVKTLLKQGFNVFQLSENNNPVYAIKYDEDTLPRIGFSKKYDHPFNPVSSFAAIMTCSQADGGCPFIAGAEKRIAITYEDPKLSDNTPEQTRIYWERSNEIAAEMFYVFSSVKN